MSKNFRPQLREIICRAWAPPSADPAWKWCEKHIVLDNTAALQGRYSTELVPFIRSWYDAAQNPRTKKHHSLVSAQSTKTQNGINFLCWSIVEDPAPTVWAMASSDNCEEFKKKRLNPAFELCEPVRKLMPADRNKDTRKLVQFASMNLLLRGSNSKVGLQSDPIRRIICDERREWKVGSIGLLRKRLRTFSNAIEIGFGTAGVEGDDLHRDFEEGSQTFIHWNCAKCGHSQPFRFGRKQSTLFPEPRDKGGLVWDVNETTRPRGQWNWEELAKTVRYECEQCCHHYKNSDKFQLLKGWHEHHRRPWMLPEHYSVHWNALYMPWPSCDWAELVKEFLLATGAWEIQKDLEPLKTFVTETLGEPWRQLEGQKVEASILMDRVGQYSMGEPSHPEKDIARIITTDVQDGHIVVVLREWAKGGASRLMVAKKLLDFDELRTMQMEWSVRDRCVWIDCAHKTRDVFAQCMRYGRWVPGREKPEWDGWTPMLGDDAKEFTVQRKLDVNAGPVKQFWKRVDLDPGMGTTVQNTKLLPRFSWCNDHYKDLLYLYYIPGKAHPWELPGNISADYIKQMSVSERVEVFDAEKKLVGYEWKEKGRHDFSDCELMQLVVADAGGILKAT